MFPSLTIETSKSLESLWCSDLLFGLQSKTPFQMDVAPQRYKWYGLDIPNYELCKKARGLRQIERIQSVYE